MKRHKLDAMTKGWFVGDFDPVVLRSAAAEVAVKTYAAGDYESPHYHRVATEVTLIVSGSVIMAGERLDAGDIMVVEPSEVADFRVLTDTITVVVKLPSATNDKFQA